MTTDDPLTKYCGQGLFDFIITMDIPKEIKSIMDPEEIKKLIVM